MPVTPYRMRKVIFRLDNETFDYLQSESVKNKETLSTVIRRLLMQGRVSRRLDELANIIRKQQAQIAQLTKQAGVPQG